MFGNFLAALIIFVSAVVLVALAVNALIQQASRATEVALDYDDEGADD